MISSVKSTCSAEVHGRNHFLESADEQGVIDVSAIHPTVGDVISAVKSQLKITEESTSWKVKMSRVSGGAAMPRRRRLQ